MRPAFEVTGPSICVPVIDIEEAAAALGPGLSAAGFDTMESQIEADDTSHLCWSNSSDGGFFSLAIPPKGRTTVEYVSGCCPTGGRLIARRGNREPPESLGSRTVIIKA